MQDGHPAATRTRRGRCALLGLMLLTACTGGTPPPEAAEPVTGVTEQDPVPDGPIAEDDAGPSDPDDTNDVDPSASDAASSAHDDVWTVVSVIDGDTVDVQRDGRTERVRIIGIDTPERGECGFEAAAAALEERVAGRPVELVEGARTDRDAYDRLLRYLDVDGVDAGLELLEEGLAIARYDSRDGYGFHPREPGYVAADASISNPHCPSSDPSSSATPPAGGTPGCVDLNSASFEELRQITHVDQRRAQEIIDGRPWPSVESLRRIDGIGDGRLRDILEQRLACA